MTRFNFNIAPMLTFFAFALGVPALGQDLFEDHAKHQETAKAEQKQPTDGREAIF